MIEKTLASGAALLPIVLAQLGGEGTNTLLWWILGLAGAAVLLNQLALAYRNLTGRFEEKNGSSGYRRRSDCMEIHRDEKRAFNDFARKSEEGDQQLRLEIKGDISGVHRRIDGLQQQITNHTNSIVGAVGDLAGQIKQMNRSRES